MGIAIALASEGLLNLQGGIALALGANIGTCATAALAAIGKPAAAVRVAVVHLAFNVIGALLWLPVLSLLAALAVRISPSAAGLEGAARAAVEVPRQLANANTLFNVINTALFLPAAGLFARLAERLVREKPAAEVTRIEARFLDEAALIAPELALGCARRETGRFGDLTRDMFQEFAAAVRDRDPRHRDAIARRSQELAALEAAILGYLARLPARELGGHESAALQGVLQAVFSFDALRRVAADDLVEIARKAGELRPSPETAGMLQGLYETAVSALDQAARAVGQADPLAARAVAELRPVVEARARELLERQTRRLRADDPEYLALVRLQMSIVERLRHVYELAERAAQGVITQAQ
jgi:phosphate:Na+ symporter